MPDKRASTDDPIQEILAQRWSPYAFENRPVPDADPRSLFEAAGCAASSYNEPPWTYLVAIQENPASTASSPMPPPAIPGCGWRSVGVVKRVRVDASTLAP